ncbi:quinoprotein dehydrogenase-associated SoxYZ-like carrier [Salinarimonas soli]|nr:quinoprotein dehydrogenase-associated SoxYZ-like carrier [Salinarimonas soli]
MSASIRIAALALSTLLAGPALAQEETAWGELRSQIVGAREVGDAAGLIELVTPKRAEDAAIVPLEVKLHLAPGDTRKVTALTLVVDENPAPVVGTFRFPEGRQAFDLQTRVRVNSYSWVRAIAETDDGRLHMTKAYVKAAGGCSAPAAKDPAEALANLGQMRFRVFADRGEAQVQLRHPNYSGLQMDQVTRLYTPAWYVEKLSVRQGDKPLFSMVGGISISEDPTFRFSFAKTGEPVTVEAVDTQGRSFRQTFPAGEGS